MNVRVRWECHRGHRSRESPAGGQRATSACLLDRTDRVTAPTRSPGPVRASRCGRPLPVAGDPKGYGTTTVCGGVAALVPQGLFDATAIVYVPGPTAPDSERSVVPTLPVNAPMTLSVYASGAPPDAGDSHDTVTRLPTRVAWKLLGVPGGVHVPGKFNVTLFDGGLVPTAFCAATDSV